MLAPTRVFCSPKKITEAGDLLACNFYPPQRVFHRFHTFYCRPAICSRVMGNSAEPLVGGVVDCIGHGGQMGC